MVRYILNSLEMTDEIRISKQSENGHTMFKRLMITTLLLVITFQISYSKAEEPTEHKWDYAPELLAPFWEGSIVYGETVLFIKDDKTDEAKASVMFPVTKVLTIRNSAGDVSYEEGRDYRWESGKREIVLPVGSRIVSHLPADMRRPAGSQKHRLTHRDGNGEIFFAGQLQYAAMQTCITYQHEPVEWETPVPQFDAQALPRSVGKLSSKQPLSIVVLGDSISTEANASLVFDSAPFQPGYPRLLQRHLQEKFGSEVILTNLSVGGTATGWGVGQVGKVVEGKPDLVILAFGMNDSAGVSSESYQTNTRKMIEDIRKQLPNAEFVLVASMLGNRDWTTLKHELFPKYRDALKELCEPGIALADMTSIWTGILERKQDWDQTGNGVNHPNDFGHRIYAQVIAKLLDSN
jgi:acyl-CoA thioesterase I